MENQYGFDQRRASASRSMSAGGVLAVVACMIFSAAVPAQAQFSSGSTGVHGAFPPALETGPAPVVPYTLWNVRTGLVRYCSAYTVGSGSEQCNAGSATNVTAQIPNIPTGGLTTGIYQFTEFEFSAASGVHRNLHIVGVSANVPLTILAQGNITFMGHASGWQANLHANGDDAVSISSNFSSPGARGGPGGFAGGGSGNGGATPGHGGAGFGTSGGAGGRTDATAIDGLHGVAAGPAPLNPSLTPLVGGSGGGGAAGVQGSHPLSCGTAILGYAGGAGGGGGGAILMAATGRVTLGQFTTIDLTGGRGASNSSSPCGLHGGGGTGGSIRIVAQEFSGNGTIDVRGGTRASGLVQAPGGQVRIETGLNTYNGSINGATGGSFLAFPTAAVPANQPVLRITSIGGIASPANPAASLVAPDITFPAAIDAPVTLAVAANNVPLGTAVNLRVVPATGQPTLATSNGLSGSFASSTANATVTLPPGAGLVTASATFQLGGSGGGGVAMNTLPLIDGRRPERVEVAVLADGSSRTYLVASSGARFEVAQATGR